MEVLLRCGKWIVWYEFTRRNYIDVVGKEQLGEIENDNPIPALLLKEPLLLVKDEWPTGTMIPLNSKLLNLFRW